ncbi:hypothetical protein N4T20_05690 [Flavobacterium sp. TR2]|uniref:hypothetical protein n=1 Tax=Flavobacterium sp. TR2 TaxID=2977321 RepID=UPI0021B12572|nr:hypothetical protein [Flavobacterium sp. TR2]UWY29426.1 hypothetical protein N4T20_05690 [Flavobacterium sp. TR2]
MSTGSKYNFKILHKINQELFDRKQESYSTYEIEIVKHYNSRIEIKRQNFKVNDKKLDSKFENIAYIYNDALFPVLFEVRSESFFLANYNEISKRLLHIDGELNFKYKGAGLEYIRTAFFEKVAKDGYAMVNYLHSLGLINVLQFCFEKPQNNIDYHFCWSVHTLDCDVFWKGRKNFNPESNILEYKSENNGDEKLLNSIKTSGNDYQYPEIVTDEESVLTTAIKQETKYNTTGLDFEFSETNIRISNSYFHYHENFSITAFSKTEDKYEY